MIRRARSPGQPEPDQPDAMQVVGIAPPIREELLDRRPVSHLYVPFGRHYRATMHLHVRVAPGTNDRSALDKIRDEIRSVDPRLPILALSTMETFHSQSMELWALNTGARTFTMLGLLALTLAVVGVYGVKSYVVAQRTREIGIRLALGATERSVLALVLKDGFFLTAMGVGLGLPLAGLVSIALASVFVDIGGFDLPVMAIAAVVLAAASTVASGIPARRATQVQPLTALRTE
jgi:ABC-type antimicrobial peptide transport system permease subunit